MLFAFDWTIFRHFLCLYSHMCRVVCCTRSVALYEFFIVAKYEKHMKKLAFQLQFIALCYIINRIK